MTVVGTSTPALATHFRFGHITWVPLGGNQVEITVDHAWRTTFFFASPAAPVDGDPAPSSGTLNFGDGGSIGLSGTIVSHNVADDWFLARDVIVHTYPTADDGGLPWVAFFDSCCRVSTLQNEPDGSFRVEAEIDLTISNSSPASTIVPIVNMTQGVLNSIVLPLGDVNGDDLTCRLATAAESGIFVHPGPPNGGSTLPLTVTSDCVLEWDTSGTAVGSLWTTQIIIEESRGGNPVHGRVALDFIIRIVQQVGATPVCDSPPTPTGTVSLTVGVPYSATVSGSDADAGDTLTLSTTGVPAGLVLTPLLPTSGPSPISTDLDWTPNAGDVGSHPLLFSIADGDGQTAFCGFTLDVLGTCGDGAVNQPSEECDGADDLDCPGQCLPGCTCPAVCGDALVEGAETCDPPDVGVEICNDDSDNDGDGDADCRDFDCAPGEPERCNASCELVSPCTQLQRDPATIRFGKTAEDADYLKIHARMPVAVPMDPVRQGFSIEITNEHGVVYEGSLGRAALSQRGKRFLYRDRSARRSTSGGLRDGLFRVSGRYRTIAGDDWFAFRVKAYGHMDAATVAHMLTAVTFGNNTATVEADWARTKRGWRLDESVLGN